MVANLVSKTRPRNRQKLENLLENWDFPSPKIQFSSHKIQLSSMAFCFLQRLFNFPQWLSAFQEVQENLFTAANIQKITI
jgi:hypothetical protein